MTIVQGNSYLNRWCFSRKGCPVVVHPSEPTGNAYANASSDSAWNTTSD